IEENISKAAGSISGEFLSIEDFVELIRKCGRIPAERDTLYRILKVF
ncbi:MAG: 7,8-didemethyl-8-hydroxy-5-deazariboflavin synthase subunit CofH, partial [Archaeoglobus sp.]